MKKTVQQTETVMDLHELGTQIEKTSDKMNISWLSVPIHQAAQPITKNMLIQSHLSFSITKTQ
jgi:hypothetical protein